MTPTCKLCGQPIEEPRRAWKEQLGWVSPHGAKSMTGAEQTGELAHPECINKMRADTALIRESLISLQNMPEALHEFDRLTEQLEALQTALRRIQDLYPQDEPAFNLAHEALNPTKEARGGCQPWRTCP